MTKAQALAFILETYSEEELRNAKDEPDTIRVETTPSATVVTLYGSEQRARNATRRHVKAGFRSAGHGHGPAESIANARRIFRQDEAA